MSSLMPPMPISTSFELSGLIGSNMRAEPFWMKQMDKTMKAIVNRNTAILLLWIYKWECKMLANTDEMKLKYCIGNGTS